MPNLTQSKNHKKTASIIFLLFTAIAVFAMYFGISKHQQKIAVKDIKIDGAFLTPAKEITDFNLIATDGKSFTKANLKGHWTMMFFGFTNCGMVCPTTLAALNKMYKALQQELPEDKLPQIVLVTVDPERDTITKMKSYVKTFNSQFLGATGDMSELISLQKQLHIVSVKVQPDNQDKNNYYYDHSAELLLINPDAGVQAYMSYPHKPEQMAKDYKLILSSIS